MRKFLDRMHKKPSTEYSLEERLVYTSLYMALGLAILTGIMILYAAMATEWAPMLLLEIPDASLLVLVWSMISYIDS